MHLSNKIFLHLNVILKPVFFLKCVSLVWWICLLSSQGLQKVHSRFSLQNTQELETEVDCSCLHPQYSKRTNEMRSLQLVASTINHEPGASLHQSLPFPWDPTGDGVLTKPAGCLIPHCCSFAAVIGSWGRILYAETVIHEGIYLFIVIWL